MAGFARLYAGEDDVAGALISEGLESANRIEDPRTLVWAAEAASAVGDLGVGLPYAGRAVKLARRKGRFSLLQHVMRRYAMELFADSQFELAYAAAEEGYRLAEETGYGRGGHLANMAAVGAVWGRDEDARSHADPALDLARRHGIGSLGNQVEWIVGFIELTAGRHAAAADRLLHLTSVDRSDANPLISRRAVPDAVEAAARAGRQVRRPRAPDTVP